ncbi:hypothetical protein [Stenotrophomonas sp. 278]|uniref:hypothetical protein n=1 Tax=Stenotrophomonas sp. 278 TaxID=2479851 RepID=UPI000F68D716|nr:hypothetical protein [Stenotrophomonas sp. 278]RRU23597.1 hypothetical protein EGJ34_02845 [Stenotrophomonas sp. 278]
MATSRLTIAIDPGLKGAIAVLADGFPTAVLDMPTMEVDGRTEIDARAIAVFIREQRAAHPGAEVLACIERVRAMPAQGRKQGAQSSMNFGDNYGKAKAVLELLGIPTIRAEPLSWKRRFGLVGQDKDASRQLALKRYPAAAHLLTRKKDDGRADALLIALWADHQIAMGKAA